MCEHKEKLLPKDKDNVKYSFRRNMDLFASPEASVSLQEEEYKMRKKLGKFALDSFRIELLVLRFVYGMTFEAIAEELNSPNVQTIFYAYSRAVKLLAERKYK